MNLRDQILKLTQERESCIEQSKTLVVTPEDQAQHDAMKKQYDTLMARFQPLDDKVKSAKGLQTQIKALEGTIDHLGKIERGEV